MLLLHIHVLTNVMECYFAYFKILRKWHNTVCILRLLVDLTYCFCDLSLWFHAAVIDFHKYLIIHCVISPQFIFPVTSIFTIINNTAMNILGHTSLCTCVSFCLLSVTRCGIELSY